MTSNEPTYATDLATRHKDGGAAVFWAAWAMAREWHPSASDVLVREVTQDLLTSALLMARAENCYQQRMPRKEG